MDFEASVCRARTTALPIYLDFCCNVGNMASVWTFAAEPPMEKAPTRAFIGFVASTERSLFKKNRTFNLTFEAKKIEVA